MEDEILDELERIRAEHAARFNYDISAMIEDIKSYEIPADWPRASFAPRRITREDLPPELFEPVAGK
ncbi:MAG: hypothetical protein U0Q16_37920 [Bryobacteraceae bacterium]